MTFTVVESGTQRNKVKLVSSDGYEYTRKVCYRYHLCIQSCYGLAVSLRAQDGCFH